MATQMSAPTPGLQLTAPGATEPKGALNHFCQRYCKRPVTKEDIVYTSAKYGKVYQVTVSLNCMEGQQFVGETALTLKDAEKNAAYQALIHLEPLSGSLPASSSKNKKRKAVAGPFAMTSMLPVGGVGGPNGFGAEPPALKSMRTAAGGTPNLSPPTSPTMTTPGGATNPALTCKVVLNTVCMKLLKRPMQKGEVVYETHQTPIGFQTTVRLPCLPGDWGELAWAGEVAQQQKQAEQNAAKEALEAVNANTDTIKSLLPMTPSKTASGGRSGGWPGTAWTDGKGKFCCGTKAKGKGWAASYWPSKGLGAIGSMGTGDTGWGSKGMDSSGTRGMGSKGNVDTEGSTSWGGELEATHDVGPQDACSGAAGQGFGPRRSQPRDMPRNRISEVALTGEIIEWKGKYGWLEPHAEIQHPMAKKRGGKVFMSHKDIVSNVELTVGTVVQFHVYEDATGLGAEEIAPF